jgi:hypothetical protein
MIGFAAGNSRAEEDLGLTICGAAARAPISFIRFRINRFLVPKRLRATRKMVILCNIAG